MRGIVFKILSALVFTLMSASVKFLGPDYPTGQLVFFRSAFAIAPLLIWLTWRGDLISAIRTRNPGGHVLRSVIGTTGMFCGFAALSLLPLSDATAIGYAAPLVTVVLAALILKEQVRAYRWGAVVVGFLGVVIMLSPHLGLPLPAKGLSGGAALGALFGLAGACCAAGATIQIRRLTATERTGAIVLYFSLLSAAIGLATAALGWKTPTPRDFLVLALIGFLGGVGQILLTQSYRYADASLVAPFEYTTMIWAILIGFLAFGQMPNEAVIVGAAIVALAGMFVLWRERQAGLAEAEEVEEPAQRPAGG